MDNAEADFWVLGFIAHGMNLGIMRVQRPVARARMNRDTETHHADMRGRARTCADMSVHV